MQYNEGNAFDNMTAGMLENAAGAPTDTVISPDGMRTFVTHNQNSGDIDGTYPGRMGSASWNVKWTAPTVRVTPICFYFAGVCANNDNTPKGDRTYVDSLCIPPCDSLTSGKRTTWGELKRRYAR